MPEPITIAKTGFPEYLDWEALRATGIRHLETLAGNLWTDFNTHDPGITILEVLCYALTDLGYRTNLSTEDLLAQETPAPPGEDDNFFSAAEILTVNPVTLHDIRRLLIDIEGVRNAWVTPADQAETPLYVDGRHCRLLYEPLDSSDPERSIPLRLRGLYRVSLELEPAQGFDACGQPVDNHDVVLDRVRCTLNAHRNLCEDFLDVVVLQEEQIRLCTEIELMPESDPDDVLLKLYGAVQAFLAPQLHYYTLQEMLGRGKSIEEIYAGRPFLAETHGFVDPDELQATEPRALLHVSDLYQVALDVPGIRAIKSLLLINAVNGIPLTDGEPWCLKLTPGHRPILDLEHSAITFYKGLLPFPITAAAKGRALASWEENRDAATKARLEPYQLDLPIPEGTHRPINAYTSIQHEFPLVYGVGTYGVDLSGYSGLERERRVAQARQLKGYLLFFDQLLAGYLEQLSRLRSLFQVRGNPISRTYFPQYLQGIPGIEQLIEGYGVSGTVGPDGVPEGYHEYLDYISETPDGFDERRNRFLDHLLARFAESFTDYVLMMYSLQGERLDRSRIIRNKEQFLERYPLLSRNRGRGFNYAPCDGNAPEDALWDSNDVAGVKQRVALMLGIDRYVRRTLTPVRVTTGEAGYYVELVAEDGLTVLLAGLRAYSTELEAWEAADRLVEAALDIDRYRFTTDESGGHGFEILDDDVEPEYRHPDTYPDAARRDVAVASVRARVNDEGFHLLEHILLRPRTPGHPEAYFFVFADPAREVPFFRSPGVFDDADDAAEALRRLLKRLLVQGSALIQVFEQDTDSECRFSYRIPGGMPGVIAAEHGGIYAREEDVRAAADDMLAYLDAQFKGTALAGDRQCYGSIADQVTASSSLGVAPIDGADLSGFVKSYGEGEPPDALLPPFRICDDPDQACSVESDPYSFQVTVVVPYWPTRFRSMAFRNFFEKTLRLESPAHVFVKVCWVDVARMHHFETAYRRWLPMAGARPRPCEAGPRLAALIDSLQELKNVYPEARLNPCDSGSPIPLNQTLLGSADSDFDGNN